MKEVKLSEIKPVGNFDFVLEKLDKWLIELENENKYTKGVSDFIKTVVVELGLIEVLSEFDEPYSGWNYEEQKISLLYTHVLLIRANNIAQKYLNGIEMDPIHKQLNDSIKINEDLKKIFFDTIIVE